MEIMMVLHLPRDVASVPVSRQVLDGCLQTLGVAPDTRADIALALSEACSNVVQHAGLGDEYHVQVTAGDGRCVIEVVNAGRGDGDDRDGRIAVTSDPVPATAEHGRGLKIINAVVDNLQLTGNERNGVTVHFEKRLQWLPGAAGQHLFKADGEHAAGRRHEPARPGRDDRADLPPAFRGVSPHDEDTGPGSVAEPLAGTWASRADSGPAVPRPLG